MTRKRADVVLVERGFFASRARAQEAIAAGLVTVNGTVVRKASDAVPEEAVITAEQPHPYVSRGGLKLAAALDAFQIDPKDRICLDIGASTGGFTEVLLTRGAAHVYAVDVGHSQLHPTIVGNARVTQSRRHRRPRPERHAHSPNAGSSRVGRELHLAQARPACRRRLAEAARGRSPFW